jgi:hypothetical protein
MLNAIAARLEAIAGQSAAGPCLDDLHLAVREGRQDDALSIALQSPGLVDMPDATGHTALHWAALGQSGHPAQPGSHGPWPGLAPEPEWYVVIAARLLELGADPDARNDLGQTPLHLSLAEARDVAMTRLLLERRADAMATDAHGNTALHLAVRGRHALELATLVHQRAGPQALRARNHYGRTPYDLASAQPPSAARAALLATLRDAPVPPDDVAHGMEAPATPDPPWAIALRMVRVALAKGASGTEPPRIKAIFSVLPPLVTGLPGIATREDAPHILASLLGHLCDLIAHCGGDDVPQAMKLLRDMLAQAPGLLDKQPLAWRLYLGYAGLWRRSRQWPEAFAYASRAYVLAAEQQDGAAAAEIEAALDDIELAALQHHCEHWAGAVLARYRAKLHDMESKWRGTDDLIETMQRIAAQLRSIADAQRTLLRLGVAQFAQGFAELAQYLEVSVLDARIADALSVARQKEDQAAAFSSLAAAILALARETAWHGHAAYGAAWCVAVASAVAERNCAAAVQQYDCGPHLAAAEALQLMETAAQADRIPPSLPAPPGNWRVFRQALVALRQRAADALAALPALPPGPNPSLSDWQAPLPIEAIQQSLTTDLTLLIGSIIEACMAPMLDPPPLAFAVLGLGSMSRADMGPYSDLEYAIVVAHPLTPGTLPHAWFSQWRTLFEFAVFCLGETSPGGDHPLPASSGLYLDRGAAAIAGRNVLIETPYTLADRLGARHRANRNDALHTDQDVAFSLLTPCLAHGSAALASNYETALRRALPGRAAAAGTLACSALQDMALRQLQADVGHLAKAAPQDPAKLHLKRQFAGPLNHALTILALLYGHAVRRPRDILAQLALSRRFTAAFLADYRWALATVQTIRLRTHLQHRCHQDEVAWDALAPDDAAALRIIEVRVVRPLWRAFAHWLQYHGYPRNDPSGLLQTLHRLNDCDPALLAFEAVSGAGATPALDRAPDVTPEAVESLVATLVHRQADIALLTHYYGVAMSRTARSRYETGWSLWRKGLQARNDAAVLIAALAELPCGNGWRGKWADAQRTFEGHVRGWLAVGQPASRNTGFAIWLPDMGLAPGDHAPHRPGSAGRYPLRTEIATQVFKPDGTIRRKPNGQRGRHTVLPVTFEADGKTLTYWIKISPENAPHENLVHRLARRASGGSGTPCSMICKLETPGRSVAALVMEGAGDEHENLETLVRTAPSVLGRLDLASFTRALLRVMLINPEDDKADDYFTRQDEEGRLHLMRVDNERAFFQPEEHRLLGANRLQVKSVLYCSDKMHARLDAAVLRDFCKLAPVRVVQSWLVEAEMLHRQYRQLFTDGEIAEHFDNRDMPCLLAVGIAVGLEQELVKRLDSMQAAIELAEHDGTGLTGMDLLNIVHPGLAKHYQRAFGAFPAHRGLHDTAIERFNWLTADSYAVSAHGMRRSEMTGINAVTRSLNLGRQLNARDVLAMAHGHTLSPAQAQLRLEDMAMRRVGDIVAGVLIGKRADRLRFARLPVRHRAEALAAVHAALLRNPAAYTPEAQQRMLRAVSDVPFRELVLTGFAAVLTDDLLETSLRGAGASLRTIDLSGCRQLTHDSLLMLARNHRQLRALRMRDLDLPGHGANSPSKALRKLIGHNEELCLPELQMLDAGGCRGLVEIDIRARRLATLVIDGCKSLARVRTDSLMLTTLDARNCGSLTESGLATAASHWGSMQSMQLENCALIQHIDFRQRYPWIADLPWNMWTTSHMARLEGILRAALSGVGASLQSPPISACKPLRAWLDTRDEVARDIGDALSNASTLSARLALARTLDPDADTDTDTDGNQDGAEPGAGLGPLSPRGDVAAAKGSRAVASASASSSASRLTADHHIGIHLINIRSSDDATRAAAAKSLGLLGASAPRNAVHALRHALRDSHHSVVAAVATALSRIVIWPSAAELSERLPAPEQTATHADASV